MRALLLLVALLFASWSHPASAQAGAPPRMCDIRYAAWCISEGVDEIVSKRDDQGGRTWMLNNRSRPDSVLVVREPYGCRKGYSDVFAWRDYKRDIAFDGRKWDRVELQLKADGSCNLELLFPPYSPDAMAWAFPNGFGMIRRCPDAVCKGSFAGDFWQQIDPLYRQGR